MACRIALVGKYYPPVIGGIEYHVRQCARVLAQEFDVKVFCMRRGMGPAQEDMIDGLPVFRAGSLGSVWRQEIPFGLSKALAVWKPDVVHFHAPNPLVAAQLGNWPGKARIVVTHHADLMRPAPVRQIAWHYYRKLLEAADSIIATTQRYVDNSPEIRPYSSKIKIIPYGIEDSLFQRRTKWTGLRKVGFLGRLEHWKGLDLLVELSVRRPDLQIHVAGSGSYAQTLARRAREADVLPRFVLHGDVSGERKTQFLQNLDALLLPSLNTGESFGIVLVEAQLCGVPVVVSDIPTGATEIAKHGEFGWTFRTGDINALEATLRTMETDPARVARVVDQAHRNALHNYAAAAVDRKMLEVWRGIADRAKEPH